MLDAKEQEFLNRLRATFQLEAEEHLRALSAGLIELEKAADPLLRAGLVESVLREAHSLKGAARSVNLKDIESICQPLESLLVALKRREIVTTPTLFDLLHRAADSLSQLVSVVQGQRTSADRARGRELGRLLIKAAQAVVPPTEALLAFEVLAVPAFAAASSPALAADAPALEMADLPPEVDSAPLPLEEPDLAIGADLDPAAAPEPAPVETVRIPVTILDALLLQAEEMIQAKLAVAQRAAEMREIQQSLLTWKAESAGWRDQRAWQSAEAPLWMAARLEALVLKETAAGQAVEQDQRALRH
ncbi:MAG: Hpt domain-containing protein, partial [Anaerolineales bacterium]